MPSRRRTVWALSAAVVLLSGGGAAAAEPAASTAARAQLDRLAAARPGPAAAVEKAGGDVDSGAMSMDDDDDDLLDDGLPLEAEVTAPAAHPPAAPAAHTLAVAPVPAHAHAHAPSPSPSPHAAPAHDGARPHAPRPQPAPQPAPAAADHAWSSSVQSMHEREVDDAHADALETHREEHLALDVALLVLMLAVALALGAVLHARQVHWLSESGGTILVGLGFGLMLHVANPGSERAERKLFFDPEFFNLVLLPPIIFESGYALDQFLFFRNLGAISAFAVLGTLVSTAVTWALIYNAGALGLFAPLSGAESGAFACLISAVDPVATLSTFSALKVDPALGNLVFGEGVLNDAVSIILFRSVLHYGVFAEFSPGVHLPAVCLSFVVTALGSAAHGVAVGLLGALLLKGLGLGRHGHAPSVEMALFWCASYLAFVSAEVPHLSGIVSSLLCGITMRRYATPNLSAAALLIVDRLLKVLATVADTVVFLLVGMATVAYAADLDVALVLCTVPTIMLARALNVFPVASLVNGSRHEDEQITRGEQVVLWWAGLRGAIALALAVQVPGSEGPRIVAATVAVVLVTIFGFGGSTRSVLGALKIAINAPAYDAASAQLSRSEQSLHEHARAIDGFIHDLVVDLDVPEPDALPEEEGDKYGGQRDARGHEEEAGVRTVVVAHTQARPLTAEDAASREPFVQRVKTRAVKTGLPLVSVSGF